MERKTGVLTVGIDFRPVHKPATARRGIGNYTHNLTRALAASPASKEIYLCVSDSANSCGLGIPVLVKWPRKPGRLHWVWDSLFLRRKLNPLGLNFFHATDQVSVPKGMAGTKILMHLHDVIPFLFWDQYSTHLPLDFRFALKRSLRTASHVDAVITDSECSRRDILKWTRAQPERVHVVAFGCDDHFKRVEDPTAQEEFVQARGIRTPYLLYVGATDHRKNLPFLIRAFGRLREAGYSGSLYLLGDEFTRHDLAQVKKIREEISRSRHTGVIHTPGYVDPRDLRLYLACADAFVFPSLYEGFGLPALEAMSCGTPVVVSNRSSIPEVVGDAGLYFDPSREDECVRQLLLLTRTQGLREELSQRGLARAELFSWRNAVEQILQIYVKLV
ncbi:MAG: glycosyltransferase family 4 protein [Acidobacteria bacterium]|nr:glycosyltransferase family 4 protein [Acidobacteriota bacterium]